MKILFVHQNFPGQYRHLSSHFAADPANRVVAIGELENLKRAAAIHPRVELCPYPEPKPAGKATHHYLRGYEAAVRRAQEVVRVAARLKASGFQPDLIMVHPGWGEALFLRDVFPSARFILFAEFYYSATGSDVGFDPEYPVTADDVFRIRIKNSTQWMSMEHADLLIAPTQWQKRQFPSMILDRIQVVHDGIDTSRVSPDPDVRVTLGGRGITLSPGDEIVTYVARNLEPYRGFHVFMRALPALLARRPQARVLIIGGDEVSYGSKPPPGKTYRQMLLDEVGERIDPQRVHFLGKLPYADFLRVLQVSTVHLYLTYPFVLSWSLLEAMAAGCMVVASRTAPVEEVIRDGENGWLVDFFDVEAIADRLADALERRAELIPLRAAARQTVVDGYDLQTVCLPRQLRLIDDLMAGRPVTVSRRDRAVA